MTNTLFTSDFWAIYFGIGLFYAFIGKPLMHYAEYRRSILVSARAEIEAQGMGWSWLHDILLVVVVFGVALGWPCSVVATIIRVTKGKK